MTDLLDRASQAEAAFRVKSGLYLLGSLEKGVTVYNQQVRAHNLAWSLWELARRKHLRVGPRIAIVGGGIAGLTVASCLVSLFDDAPLSISVFERLSDLCPLQQGSDTRWLHPKIYAWPAYGSRAPGASLPILNWSEGRASDVARNIVHGFGRICDAFAPDEGRLAVLLGVSRLSLDANRNVIRWTGESTIRNGPYFSKGGRREESTAFDTVVLAAGFGLERRQLMFPTASYWRNEQLGQPQLDGSQHSFVVSGYGDGALVDLCRLSIERFRQDTIVYEIFGKELDSIEQHLADGIAAAGPSGNLFDYFESIESSLLGPAKQELLRRKRKDTRVTLHAKGSLGLNREVREIFGNTSSVLNRVLAFLLIRSGVVNVSFSSLPKIAGRRVRDAVCGRYSHVLCRHGADTIGHLRDIISDYTSVEGRLSSIKAAVQQGSERLWVPGAFRPYPP